MLTPPPFDTITPAWIREQMKARRIKQGELAKAIGLSQTRLSLVLKDEHGKPSRTTKAAVWYLFQALGTTKERPLSPFHPQIKRNKWTIN
jgi:transcriptional regulator with XRE-family HTH domain